MKKLLFIFIIYFLLFSGVSADDELNIITREQWGANPEYLFVDSQEWKDIFQKKSSSNYTPTQQEIESNKKESEKRKQINNILSSTYKEDNKISEIINNIDGRKLSRPLSKASKVRAIVIHHTDTEYEDSYEGVRDIYKYHSLSRQWGDIGYNYIIGYNGEIFEGRYGGETSVGAHDLRNNIGTIGISVMGNYNEKPVSKAQYDSLLKLTTYLVKKYDIDLSTKTSFHKNCLKNCELPIETNFMYPIIGHRDAGHTNCPGDELYKEIAIIFDKIAKETLSSIKYKNLKLFKKFDTYQKDYLLNIFYKLELYIDKNNSSGAQKIKEIFLEYFEKNNDITESNITDKDIKIKLSYPEQNSIKIDDGKKIYNIEKIDDSLYLDGNKVELAQIKKSYRGYLEITSWDRIPSWDTNNKYNDNKFRGQIVVYLDEGKLTVVNVLKIEDYLKGLGEISNSEKSEKIKSIIISARTYALWYTENEKFPGKWYNGSDNPNEFQKYLGYSLELRSPNINKLVEETKGQVLTYDGKIIKPWYFSSSNGKTLSYYDYCIKSGSEDFCRENQKLYPFLVSKNDEGGIGKTQNGHGVGMPGTGVSYLAERGWPYYLILRYFYPGTEIN